VAKFRGDRPRELRDLAAKKKKKKNITSIFKDLPLLRTGGLIKIWKKRQKTDLKLEKLHTSGRTVWSIKSK